MLSTNRRKKCPWKIVSFSEKIKRGDGFSCWTAIGRKEEKFEGNLKVRGRKTSYREAFRWKIRVYW